MASQRLAERRASDDRYAGTMLAARPLELKLGVDTHGKAAGDENGLVASTTNITSARRSVEPQLETCIGVSAP